MPTIKVVNVIPQSHSNEMNQDSEPNLTVDPVDPTKIVISTFTPPDPGQTNGPVFVSSDGGDTWDLRHILPGGEPGDITERYGGTSNNLYAAILSGGLNLEALRTTNPFTPVAMTVLESRSNVDQPFIQATTVMGGLDVGKDRVYIGNNDFNARPKSSTVDVCLDATVPSPTFTSVRIEARSTGSALQDGPEVRPAIHPDGTIYAVFSSWRSTAGSIKTLDIVVVRDDNWAIGPNPFTALIDPSDSLPGIRVATGISYDFNEYIGQERLGGSLSIAVDPRNSSTVYISWADDQPSGYTIHVRRSTDRGVTWSGDLLTVANTTNQALAINSLGKVGLLYQQVTGSSPNQRWETHFRQTTDGVTWDDTILSTAPSSTPVNTGDPYLGDYAHLLALGKDFYGVFCANNTPDLANFPSGVTYLRNFNFTTKQLLGTDGVTAVPLSIDPFFFKVTELEQSKDFYVRDWTDSTSSHDPGLEPSSHPFFFTTSDVWNQRGTPTPNPFNANDQPQNETPWDSTLGDNYAYARIQRNTPGAAGSVETVTAQFLFSEFGTGSNYQLATAGMGTGAVETLVFNAGDTVKVAPAHKWDLPVTTSTHLCLAVEISTTDDPMSTPTLLGRAPGWPTTDEIVINDNNKAQRNMGVYPISHSGRWSFYAVIHNAATFQRDMELLLTVPTEVGRAYLEVIDPDGKGYSRSFQSGQVLILPGMQPGENRWVGLTLEVPKDQQPLSVLFQEMVGNTVVNGFGIVGQPSSLGDVLIANLQLHVSVFERLDALFDIEGAEEESKEARQLLKGGTDLDKKYVAFLRAHVRKIRGYFTKLLESQPIGDLFGISQALDSLHEELDWHSISDVAAAHGTLLHKFDAYLTMLQKAKGDPADILQNIGWQNDLYSSLPELQPLPCAKAVRSRSKAFIAAFQSGKVSQKDYPKLIGDLLGCFQETAEEAGSGHINFQWSISEMKQHLESPTELQRFHRDFLLKLQSLGQS